MSLESRKSVISSLGFSSEAWLGLQQYLELLWEANAEMNLFSRQMPLSELVDNHIIDGLLPLKHFPRELQAVADFGSGGGLPGVLYALQFPNLRYLLFEKSPKKQSFLKRCQKLAPNLEVHGEIPKTLPGIDMITARAFKPIDVILDISRNHYAKKGKYFLLKGRREKIDEELTLSKKKFKELKAEVIPLSSPVLEVERHLVLI
jgi:16S rRNA (guanine527-N7)-methyltransferase